MVERRGEVAVRGGLVDFFPLARTAVRVELWASMVEHPRLRRVQPALPDRAAGGRGLAVPRVRLGEAEQGQARQLAAEDPVAGDLLARVAEGLDVEGVESLLPLLFGNLQLLPAYLPDDALLFLVDPKRTLDRAEEVRHQADEASQASWGSAAEGATAPVEASPCRPLEDVLEEVSGPCSAGPVRLRAGRRAVGSTPMHLSPAGPTSARIPSPTPAT